MYILTRYVVWELLKYFLVTLAVLLLVVTPVMGISEGLKNGLPAIVVLWIMPSLLPEMLGIIIPVAMLFSVCSVFGRMTGSNELIAMKSLGISPMAVVWPALVLAAFLSLGTVCMHEIAATWGRPRVKRIIVESVEQIAYSILQKDHSFGRVEYPLSIIVKDVKDRKLIQPVITFKGPPKITISAAEATISTDLKARELQIKCRQGSVDIEEQKFHYSFSGEENRIVPIEPPVLPRHHRDYVAMRDIPHLVAELQTSIVQIESELRLLERQREANKLRGTPEPPEDIKKIDDMTREIVDKRYWIDRLRTEPYRRWANGFTCLCFALIGAPVAMFLRHTEALTNFFICFLPILAIYYPLLMLSDDLATSGKGPPFSFWTGNVVLAIPAVALLRWIIRH